MTGDLSCLHGRWLFSRYHAGLGDMTKPIPDRAEVALEYPYKFYSGTFERSLRFDVSMDVTGVLLVLDRPGPEEVRKSVHIHINYGLLADILQELSSQVSKIPEGTATNYRRPPLRSTAPCTPPQNGSIRKRWHFRRRFSSCRQAQASGNFDDYS